MPKISLIWEDTLAVLAFIAFAFCASTGVLSLERNAPIAAPRAPAVTGKGPQSSYPLTTPSQPAALLSHPIPYKAVLCQSGPGEKPTCRYYLERSK